MLHLDLFVDRVGNVAKGTLLKERRNIDKNMLMGSGNAQFFSGKRSQNTIDLHLFHSFLFAVCHKCHICHIGLLYVKTAVLHVDTDVTL